MKKPLTIEDLGLSPQEIEHFEQGARTAYGNEMPPGTEPLNAVTPPRPSGQQQRKVKHGR